jgi:ATP-dependent Lon protease
VGEKGTGKTTLAKHGIAKALNRPFFTISLGGESDSASFKGHDYTYEGARWGKIMDCIIQAKCMNPVFLFDELDKVSDTKIGDEIIGMLMHLTDMTQNDKYTDKYFCGIDIDMSRCLFIFSYNDSNKINHILKDRLTEIQFKSFTRKEKLNIIKKFTITATCNKIGIDKNNYIIPDKTLEYIINKYDPSDGGIREIEKIIELLFMRINLLQLPNKLNLNYGKVNFEKIDNKYILNNKFIDTLLFDITNNHYNHKESVFTQSMYM